MIANAKKTPTLRRMILLTAPPKEGSANEMGPVRRIARLYFITERRCWAWRGGIGPAPFGPFLDLRTRFRSGALVGVARFGVQGHTLVRVGNREISFPARLTRLRGWPQISNGAQ